MTGLWSVEELLQTVSAAVGAQLGAQSPAWVPSAVPWPNFPGVLERVVSRSWAVGSPTTRTLDARQSPAEGALSVTTISVRWAIQQTKDARVGAYLEGVASERLVIAAARTALLPLRLTGVPTRILSADGGYYVGDVRFEVTHRMPLT